VTRHDYYAPRANYDGRRPGTVIENYYVNGQLVERRVKIYDDRYGSGYDRQYDR
jgi:hypothetical protein